MDPPMHRRLGMVAALGLTGCALLTPQAPRPRSDPDGLADTLAAVSSQTGEPVVAPYELDADQIAWARRLVSGAQSDSDKARTLLQAITDPAQIGLRYADAATGTAALALRQKRGNCLVIASLLVGLARAVGLRAYYVDIHPNREQVTRVGPWVVRAGHVGAVIATELGFGGIEVGERWVESLAWRRIRDQEATAQHYNNRGYEVLFRAQAEHRDVPWQEAARNFALATVLEPGLAPAWNNLGVAQARLGRVGEARASYARARALGPGSAAAFSNAGTLELEAGNLRDAAALLNRAATLDPKSPEIAYRQGLALLATGEAAARQPGLEALERARAQSDERGPAATLLSRVRAKFGPWADGLVPDPGP